MTFGWAFGDVCALGVASRSGATARSDNVL